MATDAASATTRRVTDAELARYQSPYLAGGYAQDKFALRAVDVRPDGVSASCDIVEHYVPSDGAFHFTAPLAFCVVGQLAIVGAHVLAGLDRKVGEVWLMRFDVHCRRVIQRTAGIPVELRLTSARRTRAGMIYRGGFAIDGDAFGGSASFLFPLAD